MSQTVKRVVIDHFRSYRRFETELSEKLTVVVGPNAVGKTNLIEAIQLVTAGESFRRPRWEETLTEGTDAGFVRIEAVDKETRTEIEMRISRGSGRTYWLNGKQKRGAHDILGRVPSVVFSPDDLFMIKGPADERRRAVDEAGDQLSASYAALRREYARVVKQRNAALKSEGGAQYTGALDELLVSAGGRLTAHRARLAGKIAANASIHYRTISSGETLKVDMVPSWEKYGLIGDPNDESEAARLLAEALALAQAEESARRLTVVGPHRDDIRFSIDGADARRAASQGQQRSVALAWKLAELDIIGEISGNRPLLLLDDVMSELDAARRAALTELVAQGTQTLITTANLDYFEDKTLGDASILELGA